MPMLDLKNLDKLPPEHRAQFDALLDQYPHLKSKMDTSRELNTPTRLEEKNFIKPTEGVADELDYSNFSVPQPDVRSQPNKDMLPKLNVNPRESSFSSLEQEDEKEVPVAPHSKEAKDAEDARQEQLRQKRVKESLAAGQPPEIANFSTAGKTHPVLTKLRATVGLRSVQEPLVFNVGGCKYSMRPLDRGNLADATLLTMTTASNPMLYESYLESAIIAFSVVAIDSVPLYDVFSIPKEDIEDGKRVQLTQLQREEQAAKALFTELMRSPNELIEALGVHYQQAFPPLSLLGEGKVKFMCPVADCLQSRIEDYNAVCYCPVHGEKMAREDLIPNPS